VPLAVPLALVFAATVGLKVGSGQQTVPFQGGIPVAPTGLANRTLSDKPMEFDTGEGQRIRVVVMTKALKFPWAIAFTPDGTMLITERTGQLRVMRNGVLDPKPIPGGPTGYFAGESGLPAKSWRPLPAEISTGDPHRVQVGIEQDSSLLQARGGIVPVRLEQESGNVTGHDGCLDWDDFQAV